MLKKRLVFVYETSRYLLTSTYTELINVYKITLFGCNLQYVKINFTLLYFILHRQTQQRFKANIRPCRAFHPIFDQAFPGGDVRRTRTQFSYQRSSITNQNFLTNWFNVSILHWQDADQKKTSGIESNTPDYVPHAKSNTCAHALIIVINSKKQVIK